MKLEEIEKPSGLIKKAIEDGCVTTGDFNTWVLGYMTGVKDMAAGLRVEAPTVIVDEMSQDEKDEDERQARIEEKEHYADYSDQDDSETIDDEAYNKASFNSGEMI